MMFTKRFLLEIRQKALRKGIWFKSLDYAERGILQVASTILDTVKDNLLSLQILNIVQKIYNDCKSSFKKYSEHYSVERIKVIQAQALFLCSKMAYSLSKDIQFINYLMFLDYNQPTGWRIHCFPS
jgi:transcription termination factor NusB